MEKRKVSTFLANEEKKRLLKSGKDKKIIVFLKNMTIFFKNMTAFFKNATAFKKNAVAFGIKRHGVFKKRMDVGSASGLHNKIHHFLLIIYELES